MALLSPCKGRHMSYRDDDDDNDVRESLCHCVLFSHAHKHTVMDIQWNRNGNWMLTASRDHLIKLFDIRNMKDEVISFRGHKKEATSVYRYIR